MVKKKKRIVVVVLSVISAIIVGGFSLNWFLTFRLEDYLRDKLGAKVLEATDGFYQFTFDRLSVSFFSGELKIKGVKLMPDSTVFEQWAAIDSLPEIYFKVNIDEIDLLGIDLRWRLNYRKLKFDLFELQSPDIAIFESYNSGRFKQKEKQIKPKTPYELLSPFMDILSVKKINLKNSNISYIVEDPANPSVYSLKNATFRAYNFLVDSVSSKNGKLLYSDNFDFESNQSQALYVNNDFELNTNSIKLSTKDSVIHISGISLKSNSLKSDTKPKSSIDFELESLDLKQAYFYRNNYKTHLEIGLFDIANLNLDILGVKEILSEEKAKKKDNPDPDLSLFDILSPVLNRVVIKDFIVEKAKMKYSLLAGKDTTIYQLQNFDFRGSHFVVDPVPKEGGELKYFKSFILEASMVEGYMKSINYHWSAERVVFDTEKRNFQLNQFSIEPLTPSLASSYVIGSTSKVEISGLDYAKGLTADVFNIESPQIKYVSKKSSKQNNSLKQKEGQAKNHIIAPFLDYIKIKNINISDASLIFDDRTAPESIIYELKNLDLFAHDIFINDNLKTDLIPFVSHGDFGFKFKDFINYLPGKEYKLQVKSATFNSVGGVLQLDHIKLIPQMNTWLVEPEIYTALNVPHLEAKGLKYDNQSLFTTLLNIQMPRIDIVKTKASENREIAETKNRQLSIKLPSELKMILIDDFEVVDGKILLNDKTSNQFYDIEYQNLSVDKFKCINKAISFNEIMLKSPKASIANPINDYHCNLDGFSISNLNLNNTDGVSQLTLGSIDISKPWTKVKHKAFNQSEMVTNEPKIPNLNLHKITEPFFDHIIVNRANIRSANFEYSSNDTTAWDMKLDNLDLQMSNLDINNRVTDFKLNDLLIDAYDLSFPVDEGFYRVHTKKIKLDYRNKSLELSKLALVPKYPKLEFAYEHPKNKDWFEVNVDHIGLFGIDFGSCFSNNIIKMNKIQLDDAILNNFKNQKIEIEHNIMPMIYEGLQKAPIKIDIDNVFVKNLAVSYEELAKNGTEPGRIFFTELNGHLPQFTNIVSTTNQFINLEANGKLMGEGYFQATWKLPADYNNDHFLLKAKLDNFDLKELNQLISPMAPVSVENGWVNDLQFDISATSQGATIDMLFLYNHLRVSAWKEKNDKIRHYSLYTNIINSVLKSNNPNKAHRKPRQVHVEMLRDPYHSTFNYLWQILQPAVVESVGVSKKKQNFAKGMAGFVGRVKQVFKKRKKTIPQSDEFDIIN